MRLTVGRDRDTAWQIARLSPLLYALARELRTGSTVHGAVARVASDEAVAGPGFVRLAQRVEAGAPVVRELERWAAGLDHPDADLVQAVLGLGASTGGALAATLDRAAERLADRAELHREIRALSSQARASALLLTVAPFAFLVVLSLVDRRVLGAAADPLGATAIAIGAVLNGAGWVWMRRLARSVAP